MPAGAKQIFFLLFVLIFELGGIKRTINDWPHGILFSLNLNAPVGIEGLEETKVTVSLAASHKVLIEVNSHYPMFSLQVRLTLFTSHFRAFF